MHKTGAAFAPIGKAGGDDDDSDEAKIDKLAKQMVQKSAEAGKTITYHAAYMDAYDVVAASKKGA